MCAWSCLLILDDSAYFNFTEVISWVIGRHHTIKFSQDETVRGGKRSDRNENEYKYIKSVARNAHILRMRRTGISSPRMWTVSKRNAFITSIEGMSERERETVETKRRKRKPATRTWQALLSVCWFHSVSRNTWRLHAVLTSYSNVFHLNDVLPLAALSSPTHLSMRCEYLFSFTVGWFFSNVSTARVLMMVLHNSERKCDNRRCTYYT